MKGQYHNILRLWFYFQHFHMVSIDMSRKDVEFCLLSMELSFFFATLPATLISVIVQRINIFKIQAPIIKQPSLQEQHGAAGCQ
jgi:hypothetical protein